MPEFREHKTGPAIASATLHAHHQRTFLFESEWQDIWAVPNGGSFSVISHPQPERKGEKKHVWMLVVEGRAPGAGSIKVAPGPRTLASLNASRLPVTSAEIQVRIIPELALPDADSDAGLIARVLLHETLTPSFPDYDGDQDVEVMRYMRNVLENRRFRRFDLFGFKNAPSLVDILHAKGQFGGLGNYPNVPRAEMVNISATLTLANSDTDRRQPEFARHVENALAVANQPSASPDPSKNGLYAWRTARHSSPGDNFVQYKTIGNITFYTLSDHIPAPIHGAKN